MPVESRPPATHPPEPKKRRPFLQRQYLSCWKRLYRFAPQGVELMRACDKRFGAGCASAFLACSSVLDFVRRLVDFREFKRLRRALPDDFWRGTPPLRHYFTMVRTWQCTLAAALMSDRLGDPDWVRRVRIRGTPPQMMPEFRHRPVILVHLHTGAYGALHYWLRAQGLPAAAYRAGSPEFLLSDWALGIFAAADLQHGVAELPSVLIGLPALRATLKFLVPGRILTVALDAESGSSAIFRAQGHPIQLSTGVVHLAQSSGAVLVPASMLSCTIGRFEIRFKPPVPDEWIDRRNPRRAIQYLLDQLWQDVEENPSRLGWSSLVRLAPGDKPHHIPWP